MNHGKDFMFFLRDIFAQAVKLGMFDPTMDNEIPSPWPWEQEIYRTGGEVDDETLLRLFKEHKAAQKAKQAGSRPGSAGSNKPGSREGSRAPSRNEETNQDSKQEAKSGDAANPNEVQQPPGNTLGPAEQTSSAETTPPSGQLQPAPSEVGEEQATSEAPSAHPSDPVQGTSPIQNSTAPAGNRTPQSNNDDPDKSFHRTPSGGPAGLPPKMPGTRSPPRSPPLKVSATKPLDLGGMILTDSLSAALAQSHMTVPVAAYGGGDSHSEMLSSTRTSIEKLPPICSPRTLSASGYPEPMLLTPTRRAMDLVV
jgi:hypothetical protein